jgi:hypothetical protein
LSTPGRHNLKWALFKALAEVWDHKRQIGPPGVRLLGKISSMLSNNIFRGSLFWTDTH